MARGIPFCLGLLTIFFSLSLFLAPAGYCQSEAESAWDGDGGFDGDYSGIPRLRWTGPGSPDTFDDYMKGRTAAPFVTALTYVTPAGRNDARATKALVLVNSTLFSGIQANLTRYVLDLENDGYTVEVHQITGGLPEDLKTFIIANSTDLAGCVFVGDLPVAWHESDVWGYEEYPCDLFYMDLDGTWTDSDSNGRYDIHTAGSGDEGPEIFIGHIDTSMMNGDEAALTNAYLDKNHNYWNGGIFVPGYACSYTEDDWAMYNDMRTDIKFSYPSFDDIPAPATERNDYVNNRVPNADYEFIQLCCHSSSQAHYFTRGGLAYNSEIQAAVPHAMFYNLFCCSTLRYTSSNFLGGAYIYDTSQTSLAVIGSTKTGSMLEFYAFYQPFGAGECFGEAFRQWFNYLAPYDTNEIGWHYGMTIAGDPFLHMVEPALFMHFPESVPSGHQPPGPATAITVEIVDGSENYQAGTGTMHYRFDPADPFTPVAFAPLGGDLYEAVIPGAHPGDKPEFYFVAEGDGGTVITMPVDAPSSVYSFEVCLAERVIHDDFEGDTGWTVENFNITAGAWERDVPNTTSGDQVAPVEDNPAGSGTYCFLTDNGPAGGSYSDYDVDGGPTRLISPVIDLSNGDALISAYNWYYSRDGDDAYEIDVSDDDGVTWTNVYSSFSSLNGWERLAFNVGDYVTPTAQVKVRYSAQDQPNNDIVEAGVDDFTVERLNYFPALYADAYDLSVAAGQSSHFFLDAGPAYAGRSYLLLATLSGSDPGMDVNGVHIPFNWDWVSDFVYNNLNLPLFQDFWSTLDGQGEALVALDMNAAPGLAPYVGQELTFVFVVAAPVDFSSNAIGVAIEP